MRVDESALFWLLVALGSASCNAPLAPERLQAAPGPAKHGTTVREPAMLIQIMDSAGSQNERIACQTCHSLREIQPIPESPEALDRFHVGLVFAHGELRCVACHERGQVPRLHLASGESLELREALRLCAQCHGPQWRDFQHGAHGGMRGYWDRSRGERLRNHCVDCHDPHAPKYVGGLPVLAPRDRGWHAGGGQ